MDMMIAGKVAIVTGASRGLGRATTAALVAEGARVLACARPSDELDEVQAAMPENVRAVACDMRDHATVATLPRLALEHFGRVDIVVNNAGVVGNGPFLGQDEALWRDVYDVNVHAPFVLAHAAGAHFVEQGSGKVINVASTGALLGKAGLVAYTASKAALLQFSRSLADEWAPLGVQVNVVAPGAFMTSMQMGVAGDANLEARARRIPVRRLGEPEEFGPLVCYLASPLSDYVTGAVFVIDGGEVAVL